VLGVEAELSQSVNHRIGDVRAGRQLSQQSTATDWMPGGGFWRLVLTCRDRAEPPDPVFDRMVILVQRLVTCLWFRAIMMSARYS
jgi:hypothetical protein